MNLIQGIRNLTIGVSRPRRMHAPLIAGHKPVVIYAGGCSDPFRDGLKATRIMPLDLPASPGRLRDSASQRCFFHIPSQTPPDQSQPGSELSSSRNPRNRLMTSHSTRVHKIGLASVDGRPLASHEARHGNLGDFRGFGKTNQVGHRYACNSLDSLQLIKSESRLSGQTPRNHRLRHPNQPTKLRTVHLPLTKLPTQPPSHPNGRPLTLIPRFTTHDLDNNNTADLLALAESKQANA